MIILLISTIWLATLVLVVAICRMAAHGDRVVLRRTKRSPRLLDTPDPWEQALSLRLEDRRAKHSLAPSEPSTARSSRGRSEPSTAEYVGNGAQEDLYVRP
jgi:hypothetical protein